ncbi:MAG: hypothetical protein ACJ716_03350 [Marmoricola sp.]
MKVTGPDGSTWRVSRRWVPWRRQLKGGADWGWDFPPLGDDPISLIIGIVLMIVLLPALVVLVLAGIELAALLVVFPFAILARVFFGRHWFVEVRDSLGAFAYEVDGGSYRTSAERIRQVADRITRGT